ncbi:MAG: type I 3-dehydroquinate dehydratase [Deltaproteobacteria bacterium]|nr:type I 3-dehydroquinate dehydratase [Deltaproteobacteria bacterium]
MICLTGAEDSVHKLAQRLQGHQGDNVLHELRLDALRPFDESVFALCNGPHLLVTCRPLREHGAFEGSEAERLEILRRAAAAGAGYLDLELSTDELLRRPLQHTPGGPKIVLSWHAQREGEAIPWHALQSERAHTIKVACAISDAADLEALLPSEEDARPTIRIAMGEAGLLSRALYHAFGSPWTYVAARPEHATAPGQLTWDQAQRWRIAQGHTPLGLIGGPQIAASPGPQVYNALFSALDWPFIYLPVLTQRPRAMLPLLERLGFAGLSVTMPAKELLLSSAHVLDQRSSEVGALNTLRLDTERREGLNTDVLAVERLLARQGGEPALVLGTGGAARAALGALSTLGCPATISGRNEERTRALARRFRCSAIPWSKRMTQPTSIIINTTPCGVSEAGSPLEETYNWQEKTLLDAPITAGDTAFAHHARMGGAKVIDGRAWWLEQGLAQMEALLHRPIPRPLLEEMLHG